MGTMEKAKVPASSDSWDYEYIRRVNLMLDNIDQSSMNDAEKAHWRSVGYFFALINILKCCLYMETYMGRTYLIRRQRGTIKTRGCCVAQIV